jgi:transcriptional regulator with XRE-family HTH domain
MFGSKSLCTATNTIPGLLLKFEVCSPVPNLTLVDFRNLFDATEDQPMIIGDRLRALREEKKFSQGDVEKRTGLIRCYISRVENGHTVPAVETLEKFARALEIPMYQLLYDGEEPPTLPNLPKRKSADDIAWGSSGKDARLLAKFCHLFSRMEESNRRLVLFTAQKMTKRKAV